MIIRRIVLHTAHNQMRHVHAEQSRVKRTFLSGRSAELETDRAAAMRTPRGKPAVMICNFGPFVQVPPGMTESYSVHAHHFDRPTIAGRPLPVLLCASLFSATPRHRGRLQHHVGSTHVLIGSYVCLSVSLAGLSDSASETRGTTLYCCNLISCGSHLINVECGPWEKGLRDLMWTEC